MTSIFSDGVDDVTSKPATPDMCFQSVSTSCCEYTDLFLKFRDLKDHMICSGLVSKRDIKLFCSKRFVKT